MIDIIIFAAIAAFMASRLYAALGKDVKIERDNKDLPPRRPFPVENIQQSEAPKHENDSDVAKFPAEIMANVLEIQKLDPSFTLSRFLKGASSAFEMIVKAITQGDEKIIRKLMSESMAAEFMALIKARKTAGKEVNTTVISVTRTEPVMITLNGNIARIKVNFASEQINFTRNSEGVIVDGNVTQIEVVEDSWVFERDVKSMQPIWLLVDTE